MTTTAPSKVTLTCTLTGKTVVWTNKAILQKKIDQFGSLEAFQAQFKCRGANKPSKSKNNEHVVKLKPVMEQGVRLGKMSKDDYQAQYVNRTYTHKGIGGEEVICNVYEPKP